MLQPQEGAVTKLHRIAVTVAGKPGAAADLYVNDQFVAHDEIRIDGKLDFLNVLVPDGPVNLRVDAVGVMDRIFTASRTVHILGSPQKITTQYEHYELDADGKSTSTIELEIQDEWGYRLDHLKVATVSLTAGTITNPDFDSMSSGHQIPIQDGKVSVTITAPSMPGSAWLDLNFDGDFDQIPIHYLHPTEPLILVGMVNGTLSQRDSDYIPSNLDAMDPYAHQGELYSDDDFNISGRTALYARGTLPRDIRLTASYDSERDREDQFFEMTDPSDQYPLYGDASTVEYDTPTHSKLYLRLDREQSHIIVGDYQTGFENAEFSAYNRTLNGVYSNLQLSGQRLQGFAAQTDHSVTVDRIRGEGISGYYHLSNQDVTRYSEKLVQEVRDRYRSEKVLKTNTLTRFHDYEIDYRDGTLMFKQPIPSVDESGNPVYIVATYESAHGVDEVLVTGLRYEGLLVNRLSLGATAIYEEHDPVDYHLYGLDTRLPLTSWLGLRGEVATSQTADEQNKEIDGLAFKIEAKFDPTQNVEIETYYREVDSNFVNLSQSSGRTESASRKYGFTSLLHSSFFGSLKTEYFKQFLAENQSNEERREVLGVSLERNILSATSFSLAYQQARREVLNSTGTGFDDHTSELVISTLKHRFNQKLSGHLEHVYNLKTAERSKPDHILAGLGYDISERIHVFFSHRIMLDHNSDNETIFGFDSKVTENTQLTGKYEVGGALGENRSRATVGLRNKWSPREDLTFNLSYEKTATFDSLQTPTPEHDAVSMSMEFLPEAPWRLTSKFENRNDRQSSTRLYALGGITRFADGYSLLLKVNHSHTSYKGNDPDAAIRGKYQIGMAYRPDIIDHLNSLFKLEYHLDENDHVDPDYIFNRMIIALHTHYQPASNWEFSSRLARRFVKDEEGELFSDQSTADHVQFRIEHDLSSRWSLAGDMRWLKLDPSDELQTGLSGELNYLIYQNIQLGLGYIFIGYDDPDFSVLDNELNRIYLNFSMKFSENLLDQLRSF